MYPQYIYPQNNGIVWQVTHSFLSKTRASLMCLVVPQAVGWMVWTCTSHQAASTQAQGVLICPPLTHSPTPPTPLPPPLPLPLLTCFPAPPTRLSTISSRVEKDKSSILLEAQSHLPVDALGPSFQCSSPSFENQPHYTFLCNVVMAIGNIVWILIEATYQEKWSDIWASVVFVWPDWKCADNIWH